MPGHSEAFTRAMGFNMQTDQGVEVLKTVLGEVCDVFKNAPYIHIGGDEVAITYPNFLSTMAQVVHNKGKKVICWNRLVSGPPSSSYCDMTQMWATAGRPVQTSLPMDEDLSGLSDEERTLLQLLREADDGILVNDLAEEADISYSDIITHLMLLEMKKLIKSFPGGKFRAV